MWNFNDVEAQEYLDLVDGIYEVKVESSELKTTQSGGEYIKLVFDVFANDGKKLNCKHFENYNVKHSNEKAVQIGMGNLKTLMIKGKRYPEDGKFATNEDFLKTLVGCAVNAKIKVAFDEQGRKNAKITSYKEALVLKSDALVSKAKVNVPDDIGW